jgi:hypothetical protein
MAKVCICNSDAYHSWYAKVQKTYCFRCGAYVDSEILAGHEEECLPNMPLTIPDVLGSPSQYDLDKLEWHNLPISLAIENNWYISTIKGTDYLVLPVYRNSKMVFWTARNLDKKGEPKYLSAHGSRKHYWLSDEQYPTGDLFIAESIADACYLSQLGQSVGLLGTSYNGSLDNWMKSASRIIIAFDGDVVGRIASLTLAKYLCENKICKRVSILAVETGKDPVDINLDTLTILIQGLK